jgi:hypothetical protein
LKAEKYGTQKILKLFQSFTLTCCVVCPDEGIASASHSGSSVLKPNYRQRKERKTGLTTIELQRRFPDLYEVATKVQDEGESTTTTSKQPK